MNSPLTIAFYALSPVVGFAMFWTADDIWQKPSDSLPPAIHINEIVIREDGSTVYDREILTGQVWQAWSGVIFSDDEYAVHCKGGALAQYTGPLDDPTAHDVDWLVGGDCLDGLEAGMRYAFTWTPVGPDYAPVRYPAEGYGIVKPAQ